MARGKPKSRFNFQIDNNTGKEIGCEFESDSWCKLPKFKRCEDCIRLQYGRKACYVKT